MVLFRRALIALAMAAVATPAAGQLIPIRVIPVAEADQFAFFPSANFGMAHGPLALPDSQLDPVRNPALASRIPRAQYFGGPTFFAVTNDAGSGQTFPLGAFLRIGRAFVGGAMAVQEIAPARRRDPGLFFPGPVLLSSVAPGPFVEAEANEPRTNRHAHATVGYSFARGLSVGASAMWSDLNAMEGSELMFTGSHSLVQRGERSELRIGALKEWGSRSLEGMLLTTRQDMAYDVGYAQLFWNPATRQTQFFTHQASSTSDARTDGLHLQYAMPLRDSTWRLGAMATANVIRESGSPYYEFMGIPRDPSSTRAFNFGAGVSRRRGPTTLAVDAILEPAWRRATGPADTMFAVGAPTNREESYFRFHNVLLRGAAAREIAMAGSSSRLRLQAGTQVRAVRYELEQHDFLRGTWRSRSNSWREWTHGAGANFVFDRFEFGYQMRVLSGMGRLGVPPNTDNGGPVVLDSFLPGPVNVGVTLYPVRVTSHQMFLTVPVR